MSLTMTVFPPAGDIVLSGNPVWIKVYGAPAPAGATQYKFLCKVELPGGDFDGILFTDGIAVTDQLNANFNIQGYIDVPVSRRFSWPRAGGSVEYTDPTIAVEYTLGISYISSAGVYTEEWEAAPRELTALKGGVSQRQLEIWYENNQNFYATYIGSGKFLTQRPQDDICHPYQPVSIWHINAATVTKFVLTCFYSDGTNTANDIDIFEEAGKLYELRVNPWYNEIDLELENGAKLLTWTVRLYNNSTPVGDTRRFAYDWRYIERPFWLMFANSLGGVDDVYLSGFATEGFETEGTLVYKPPLPTANTFDRTLFMPNKQGRNRWKINTGWKTATQMLHLRDLLLSREVWLIYPNNGVSNYYVIPVSITNTGAELINRQNDLYSLDIEMEEAHNSPFNFDNRLY